jgi:hypothetical protein
MRIEELRDYISLHNLITSNRQPGSPEHIAQLLGKIISENIWTEELKALEFDRPEKLKKRKLH